MRNDRVLRTKIVEQIADRRNDFYILFFVPPTDVISLAGFARSKHHTERLTMVNHVEPITHILTVSVYGQWFALSCVEDHQRDEFFRKLVGSVVVRAVRR